MTRPRRPGAAAVLPVRGGVPGLLAATIAASLLAACGHPAGAPAAPDGPGVRLYLTNCVACHQAGGEGVKGVQPSLAGTVVTVGDPADLLGWVMFGRRPAALPAGVYAGVMPQFSYLADPDLAALLTHVRASFGNHAPPVTVEMVAAARRAQRGL